jgi:SAM-dependent methyltransferase
MYEVVYVIDDVLPRLQFLEARRNEQGLHNIHLILSDKKSPLPILPGSIDLVSICDSGWIDEGLSFELVSAQMHRLLKNGGILYFLAKNKMGIQNLWRSRSELESKAHSMSGYVNVMEREGFSEIDFYAPLPFYDGIPLFYLPLNDKRAMRYFFEHNFQLFEMVSPEVKKQYGLQYTLAKTAVKCALPLGLTGLSRHFLSGFAVFARKGAGTGPWI